MSITVFLLNILRKLLFPVICLLSSCLSTYFPLLESFIILFLNKFTLNFKTSSFLRITAIRQQQQKMRGTAEIHGVHFETDPNYISTV